MSYTKTPITAKQVAEITGIKEKTILNRGAGTEILTRRKHGRLVRFIRQQVEAFAEGKPLTEIRLWDRLRHLSIYSYKIKGKPRYAYKRKYKKRELRKRGFATKGEAEASLRLAMDDIDATERGEIIVKPTTAQDALGIYRRNLEIRAKDKGHQYAHNVKSNCKVLQEFVDRFGADRLVREVTATDLREFYQVLCFRMTRNSAGTLIERVQGMLKAAQEAKPDLVNWLRPKLSVNRKVEHERRVITPGEYSLLVQTLLSPPLAPSRRAEREALWRDAGDAVQVLRLTGGRLNEVLRMKVDQFNWAL